MKHIYNIKEQTENETRLVYSSTTKRDIESMFNYMMKGLSKDSNYLVQKIRMGYTKVTYFGTYGKLNLEYWIERV